MIFSGLSDHSPSLPHKQIAFKWLSFNFGRQIPRMSAILFFDLPEDPVLWEIQGVSFIYLFICLFYFFSLYQQSGKQGHCALICNASDEKPTVAHSWIFSDTFSWELFSHYVDKQLDNMKDL